MANINIKFELEDQEYEVSIAAYRGVPIMLPDGRLIKVTRWYDGMPPKVAGIEYLECVKASEVQNPNTVGYQPHITDHP